MWAKTESTHHPIKQSIQSNRCRGVSHTPSTWANHAIQLPHPPTTRRILPALQGVCDTPLQFSCRKTNSFHPNKPPKTAGKQHISQTIHPNKQNERGTLPETGWHPSLPQSAYSIGCGLNFLTTIVDLTCCKITTKKTFPQSHKKGILHRRNYSLFVSETHRQHPSELTKHPL